MRKHSSALIGLRSQCKSLFMITWGCEEQLPHVHKQKNGPRKTRQAAQIIAFSSISLFARLSNFIHLFRVLPELRKCHQRGVRFLSFSHSGFCLFLSLLLLFVRIAPGLPLASTGHFIRNMYTCTFMHKSSQTGSNEHDNEFRSLRWIGIEGGQMTFADKHADFPTPCGIHATNIWDQRGVEPSECVR